MSIFEFQIIFVLVQEQSLDPSLRMRGAGIYLGGCGLYHTIHEIRFGENEFHGNLQIYTPLENYPLLLGPIIGLNAGVGGKFQGLFRLEGV